MEKKKAKFNVVDIVILLLILAVAGVFVSRYAARPDMGASQAKYPFVMTMDIAEANNETFQNKLFVGDVIIEKTGARLGVITSIETRPSLTYAVTSEGETVHAPRPNHSHLIITVDGEGFRPAAGGLMADGLHLVQNRGYEVNITDSVFWFRVVNFTLDQP